MCGETVNVVVPFTIQWWHILDVCSSGHVMHSNKRLTFTVNYVAGVSLIRQKTGTPATSSSHNQMYGVLPFFQASGRTRTESGARAGISSLNHPIHIDSRAHEHRLLSLCYSNWCLSLTRFLYLVRRPQYHISYLPIPITTCFLFNECDLHLQLRLLS